MKEISSFFSSEVFRPIVTLIIPGTTATVFYLLSLQCLLKKHIEPLNSLGTYQGTIILFFVFVSAGLIIENIGSMIECHIDEKLDKESNGKHDSDWYEYLRLAFKYEPVGHRYLRTVVFRLKFELAFGIGSLFAIPGLIWYLNIKSVDCCYYWLAMLFAVVGFFLLVEAKRSAVVLSRVRAEILKGITMIGD